MRFYFVEVTYCQNPIIWKVEGSKNIARGVQVYDLAKSEVVDITSFDAAKLSVNDGILIQDTGFFIPNVDEYLRTHAFNKIIYRRISAKTPADKDKVVAEDREASSRCLALAKLLPEKMQESTIWATTMASSSLNSKNEAEIGFYLNLPIIVEKQLVALKSRETSCGLNYLKVQRLKIIEEIIKAFFDPLLTLLNQNQYSMFFEYMQNAVRVTCNTTNLDAPLDHEQYDQDPAKLPKECLELIELSKKIEIARAKVIATHFAFENLPGMVRMLLEKRNCRDVYIVKYDLLVANIVQTGRQIRANKKLLEEFIAGLHNNPTDESEYVKLDFCLEKVFPCSTKEKSKYTWEQCEKLLLEKIARAIVLIDENRKKRNCATLINYVLIPEETFLNDPRLFIKAKHQSTLVDLLRVELLPANGKDFYKELHHKIKDYKVDKMVELLQLWMQQPKMGFGLANSYLAP